MFIIDQVAGVSGIGLFGSSRCCNCTHWELSVDRHQLPDAVAGGKVWHNIVPNALMGDVLFGHFAEPATVSISSWSFKDKYSVR